MNTLFALDETHAPALASWVDAANAADADFPLQNLPIGVWRDAGSGDALRPGVAIGDRVVDLLAAAGAGLLPPDVSDSLAGCRDGTLNDFMRRGAGARQALRLALSSALRAGVPAPMQDGWQRCLRPLAAVETGLPCRIGDYTDFYASIHHATTVGRQFRPDNPLLPNYRWVPIGYHGRASSVVASGHPVRRPLGQRRPPDAERPVFGPSRRLDYELEVGAFVALSNALGEPVPMASAESHLFGLALFNDWSARDIQGWEYQPLGPFLAKNFASTVSPWIVTMEALAPFRVPFVRGEGEPAPMPYLDSAANRASGAIDIQLEVWLQTAAMRAAGHPGDRLSRSSFRDAYWTLAQLVAHHTVGGCNLQPGDLLGSGTMSGPAPEQGGSLLELSDAGRRPLVLSSGETRSFLEDGDCVILRGWCERPGARRIGFGECRGTVLPALAMPS